MNKLYTLFLGLTSLISFAQLYVSPNSFVYVDNEMVFVNNETNLRPDSNIYLRNEAQLLQGGTSTSTNIGLGSLSVFQEGTVNNFSYNYWCSPVGIGSTTIGNELFGISLLNRPIDKTTSIPAIILTPPNYDGIAVPLSISARWIFKYFRSNDYLGWVGVYGATNIEPGLGFTMKGTSGDDNVFSDHGFDNNENEMQRYDFRGKPNDGDISIPVDIGQRTLMGNPYPSAIDLKFFLENSTNITKAAYFWEHDTSSTSHLMVSNYGGYGMFLPGPPLTMGIYNKATFYAYDGAGTQLGSVGMGTDFDRRFCPIGQGFMVIGNVANSFVTMNNSFRVFVKEGSNSDFNRGSSANLNPNTFLPNIQSVSGYDYTTTSTTQIPQIKLAALINSQAVKPLTLAFYPGLSDEAEDGMDGQPFDLADNDVNFLIGDIEYVVNMFEFNEFKTVPLGFRASVPATFKIAVSDIINFDDSQDIYVHDKLYNTYHNIKNDMFEVEIPAGGNNSRYELTFSKESSLDVTAVDLSATLDAMQNNATNMLSVSNPQSLDIRSIKLYDISGKLIFDKQKLGQKLKFEYSTSGLSDSFYILKVVTKDGFELTKKITVFKSK